jgi:hypothetical protein
MKRTITLSRLRGVSQVVVAGLLIGLCTPGQVDAAWTLIDPLAPQYTWWNGCSPTAAGMLFAWWDMPAGGGMVNLYDGDATIWVPVGDSSNNPADYTGTHRLVASWEHRQAGMNLGLTYGSYQNHTANCLADFMGTEDGGTYRDEMAQGFVDFAAWDDPTTAISESYAATAWTDYIPAEGGTLTYDLFCDWIDSNKPLHLGITGHSVLAVGYDPDDPKANYICWDTWAGDPLMKWYWDGTGVPGGMSVYGATFLEIEAPTIPAPGALLLAGLGCSLVGWVRRRQAV